MRSIYESSCRECHWPCVRTHLGTRRFALGCCRMASLVGLQNGVGNLLRPAATLLTEDLDFEPARACPEAEGNFWEGCPFPAVPSR